MKKTTGTDRSVTSKWRPQTRAVRAGTWRSEHGETSEALFLTSGYAYDDAETAAARFRGEDPGMTYSRLQNPTVAMLEERIAAMEGSEACRVQSSGMAAMTDRAAVPAQPGRPRRRRPRRVRLVPLAVDQLLPRFGIASTTIDARDNQAWVDAIRPNTKVFFFETPANPTMDIVDLRFVCGLARERGITSVVDNAFATAGAAAPLEFGADVVAYSATKLMDGQGRVLAGAVCGTKEFINDKLLAMQRHTGPNLSPFNAWVVLKGLETLDLRVSGRARTRSRSAASSKAACRGSTSRPAEPPAAQPGDAADGRLRLVLLVRGRRRPRQAHAVLDALELIDISNNIGDSRSLMCHNASTTHYSVSAEAREEMGVTEGMLRLNVGLEDPDDLIEDLDQALAKARAVKRAALLLALLAGACAATPTPTRDELARR
jgi:cystathionine gamma-synthase/O-succinylhomoserine sulfhydrylase